MRNYMIQILSYFEGKFYKLFLHDLHTAINNEDMSSKLSSNSEAFSLKNTRNCQKNVPIGT